MTREPTSGIVRATHVGPERRGPVEAVERARPFAGRGLEEDRYRLPENERDAASAEPGSSRTETAAT